MAVRVEAFRLSGRVEIDARTAHKDLTRLEGDAKSLSKFVDTSARSFSGLKDAAEKQAKSSRQNLALAYADGKKNIGGLVSEARRATKEFERLEKAEAKAMRLSRGGGFSRMFGGSGGILPGLSHVSNIIQGLPQIGQLAGALVSPLTDAAQAGIQFNAFLETSEIAFKRHFGGSRLAARGFIDEIRDFAGKSPFGTEGLIKTVVYGTATGFSPREALQLVKDVGDAIASTGEISEETVSGVVRALSQMKAKGVALREYALKMFRAYSAATISARAAVAA